MRGQPPSTGGSAGVAADAAGFAVVAAGFAGVWVAGGVVAGFGGAWVAGAVVAGFGGAWLAEATARVADCPAAETAGESGCTSRPRTDTSAVAVL
jgi:hypothetical protein